VAAEVDLLHGVTAAMVIDRREQLASGLRRPLGSVWPEPVTSEHAGRLELWVGRQDVAKSKQAPWPLARGGHADIFAPVPFGTDVRGRVVPVKLIYGNALLGSIPRAGKPQPCGCWPAASRWTRWPRCGYTSSRAAAI
jgi:DNA segregation ATPase FtsK/SpoIIIE, S-DNA-T family